MIDPSGLLAAAYSPTRRALHARERVVAGYAARGPRRRGPPDARTARCTERRSSEGGVIDRGPHRPRCDRHRHRRVRRGRLVARDLALSVGVDLPVTPLRRQILITEPVPGVDPRTPFTIDFASSFYFHRRGPGSAARDVRPGRDARLQARPGRGVAARPRRGHRAAGAVRWPTSGSPPAGPGSTR